MFIRVIHKCNNEIRAGLSKCFDRVLSMNRDRRYKQNMPQSCCVTVRTNVGTLGTRSGSRTVRYELTRDDAVPKRKF